MVRRFLTELSRVAGAFVLLLAVMGTCAQCRHQRFDVSARVRVCVCNQSSLDKCVGVWESQNVVALPVGRDLWIDFWTDGTIARVSPDLEAFMKTQNLPQNQRLGAGSKVLFDYGKDLHVFNCPQRSHDMGRSSRDKPAPTEVHYRWRCGPKDKIGRIRGTRCKFYYDVGPREDPSEAHRP